MVNILYIKNLKIFSCIITYNNIFEIMISFSSSKSRGYNLPELRQMHVFFHYFDGIEQSLLKVFI